jgi:hypothetical protein
LQPTAGLSLGGKTGLSRPNEFRLRLCGAAKRSP